MNFICIIHSDIWNSVDLCWSCFVIVIIVIFFVLAQEREDVMYAWHCGYLLNIQFCKHGCLAHDIHNMASEVNPKSQAWKESHRTKRSLNEDRYNTRRLKEAVWKACPQQIHRKWTGQVATYRELGDRSNSIANLRLEVRWKARAKSSSATIWWSG